jgi:Zn-dependent M28 family amino/carboxypeptidase
VAAAQSQIRGGGPGRAGGQPGRGGAQPVAADITTVQNVQALTPPTITADDEFYSFVFGAERFADIKARAAKGESLPPATVPAKITVNIDNTYDVISTQYTKNVVGMVEGSDPKLEDTYVLFGSHLDHVGPLNQAQAGRAGGAGAAGPQAGPPDLINNGADDDGSGSVALMGMAKAFATGPKPKRSVIFVWHAGEEAGLLGSRYMADFPVVPLEKVQAQFNIDMIGRNRNDDPKQGNTVFMIGADRISTDIHNLVVDTNGTLPKPMTLDYEYNDPNDSNSFYTRSDHYSYAAKGIPIAFFFTGTHVDYHRPGDHADKIIYPKLTTIAQLVYQSGFNVANSDKTLVRDNKGPRSGRGFSGRIEK